MISNLSKTKLYAELDIDTVNIMDNFNFPKSLTLNGEEEHGWRDAAALFFMRLSVMASVAVSAGFTFTGGFD